MSDSSPSPGTWSRRQPWKSAVGLLEAASAVALVATGLGFVGTWHWALDLFSHFRGQYLLALAGSAVVLVAARRWLAASLFLIGAAVNAHQLAPLFIAPSTAPTGASPLSLAHDPRASRPLVVLTCNLLYRNAHSEQSIEWLRASQADVLFLCEITPAWAKALRSLADVYPHQHFQPQDDPFGCALLGRRGWSRLDVLDFGPFHSPSIAAVFPWHGRDVLVLGMHPCPPTGRHGSLFRDAALAEATDYLAAHPVRTRILAGDLNATPWSHAFRGLIARTGLRDSAHGFGWQPTWQNDSLLFQIPIDHILVSSDVQVLSREIGPPLGSDHRAVKATLLPGNPQP